MSEPEESVVEPVPPLATPRVPVMVARVVVATHAGTPFTRPRTWPLLVEA